MFHPWHNICSWLQIEIRMFKANAGGCLLGDITEETVFGIMQQKHLTKGTRNPFRQLLQELLAFPRVVKKSKKRRARSSKMSGKEENYIVSILYRSVVGYALHNGVPASFSSFEARRPISCLCMSGSGPHPHHSHICCVCQCSAAYVCHLFTRLFRQRQSSGEK